MDFKILGPLEVVGSDGAARAIPGPKRRSLLALLLIHANEVLSKDRIVDALWGDDPPSGGHATLRFHISKLRAALGDDQDRIITREPGYGIEVHTGEIDSESFRDALTEAGSIVADDPSEAALRYRRAAEMWRGPAYVDFEYEDYARTEIARLEELRLSAVEGRIEAELAAGRHDDLVGELRSLSSEYPLRERIWGALMTALYRSGRQAEALRAYQEARNTLGDELGIEPSVELRDLEEKVLLQDDSISAPEPQRRSNNLPARVSRFVGRDHELSTIRKLLDRSRLVTLLGVGGVGKTSLAVETGRRLLETSDEVWLVDLAPVTQSEMGLVVAAAEALGVHTRSEGKIKADIIARLAPGESLLIFDNCEHLVADAAELIVEVLQQCPKVRVVATSRELLGVPGEVMYGVPPMTLAAEEMAPPSDAVALFLDRAGDTVGNGDRSRSDLETVERICATLDGLPLAIELAAARLRVLSLVELEHRLVDRFAILASGSRTGPARQRTLRATVDWSYDLLSVPEQWLFAALSVFPGTFTTKALEAVVSGAGRQEDPLELLAALVDKSLVVRSESRYHLLPTLRSYASERIEHPDRALVRQILTAYFVRLAADLEEALCSQSEESSWSEVLRAESAGMRSALAWAIEEGDTEKAVALAGAMAIHWTRAGLWHESAVWLQRPASAAVDAPQTVQLRDGLILLEGITGPAEAFRAVARVASDQGDYRRAIRLLSAADCVVAAQPASAAEGHGALVSSLRREVGDSAYEAATAEGRVLVGLQ